jgi:hypothetical protein
VLILKVVKVLCYHTLLEVLILKDLEVNRIMLAGYWKQARINAAIFCKNLGAGNKKAAERPPDQDIEVYTVILLQHRLEVQKKLAEESWRGKMRESSPTFCASEKLRIASGLFYCA